MTVGFGGISPASAVETITIRMGPLRQSIQVQDLESFAETGQVPDRLRPYSALLNSQTREALRSRLALDPTISNLIFEEILHSPGGRELLDTLQTVAPTLSITELREAIQTAAHSPSGLSTLSLLRALPQETLEIDVTQLLSLASQFNLSHLENKALSRVLDNQLFVPADDPVVEGFDPTRPGPESVEHWNLTLRDRERDRSIPVDLYWSYNTQGPLVILSHGFGADRRFLAYLAEHLASYGLTVVSVEHPGSNVAALTSPPETMADEEVPRIFPATELLDRPRDISYVLDRLEHLNHRSYSLRGRLNTDNVTFIGHSLGGYTGLALAGATLDTRHLQSSCESLNPASLSPADWFQCAALDLPLQTANLRDSRITRLIAMNPLTGELFGEAGLSQVKIPTLMLASTRDGVTPMAQQQLKPFSQLPGEKHLIVLVGGTHLSVGDPANINPELQQVPFMPELPGLATAYLREFLQGVSLSFIMQETSAKERYKPFLSAAYAQHYSNDLLQLRFSERVPESVKQWLTAVDRSSHHRDQVLDYLPSLLRLEAIDMRHRVGMLQQQIVAYLRTTPPSLTAIYVPRHLLRPHLYANRPRK